MYTIMSEASGQQMFSVTDLRDRLQCWVSPTHWITLRSLVVSEVGFGGVVTGVSDTHVEVETRVLNKTDVTLFRGPEEEISAFLTFLKYLKATKETLGEKITDDSLSQIADENGTYRPFDVAKLFPVIHGRGMVYAALLVAVMDMRCKDDGDAETLMEFVDKTSDRRNRLDLLCDVYAGCHEHLDMTLQEILECCDIKPK